MFKLIFDKKSGEELSKLPRDIQKRIFNKLLQTKENPLRYFERLKEVNGFKLRVGDYRVIADIDLVNKLIRILKIGHRRNIYDYI